MAEHDKVRCDPHMCCGTWHDYPDIVPCPKCGSADNVSVWEAWGHPNGQLFCWECSGMHSSVAGLDQYFTFRVEDGETVIVQWEKQLCSG